MWGKVCNKPSKEQPERIIPTGVGKRGCVGFLNSIDSDHPHGCGEKWTSSNGPQAPGGSSPRVWGKGHTNFWLKCFCRIIPTGVGKRTKPKIGGMGLKDHPHGCGEKFQCLPVCLNLCGSSPRVWGKGRHGYCCGEQVRIIPTGVGKSSIKADPLGWYADHPHGCGEKP